MVDAGGGTILPGLIDCAHAPRCRRPRAERSTFGVTTALDMFSQPDLMARAKEQAEHPAGRGRCTFLGDRRHCARRAPVDDVRPVPDVGRRGSGRAVRRERVAEGSDYLKIFAPRVQRGPEGGAGAGLLETVKALVEAAHSPRPRGRRSRQLRRPVIGEVVSAGVDVVAHAPVDGEVDKALAGRIAEAGIVVGPTLATTREHPRRTGRGSGGRGPATRRGCSGTPGARGRPLAYQDGGAGECRPTLVSDLILVPGDPLTDITATRAIECIWRAGVPCDRRAFVANAAEADELDMPGKGHAGHNPGRRGVPPLAVRSWNRRRRRHGRRRRSTSRRGPRR